VACQPPPRPTRSLSLRVPVRTSVTLYPLEQANAALAALRAGAIEGAAVLVPGSAAIGG